MENPNTGSAAAPVAATGNPTAPAPSPASVGAPAGQAPMTGGAVDNSKAYDELMSRFGTQGQELGEYRTFFEKIAPLLDKLDQAPELVQAIVDGKIDKGIAQAVMEGRVDVRDAVIVQQAADAVKDKLGEEKFNLATPESITKLVEAQVGKFRKEFEEKADLQAFQDYSQKFIEKTPDFQEYADEVDKWLDTHDVADIEVAYYAVKGKLSETKAQGVADAAAAERAKEVMANASGGGQTNQFTADGTPLVDKLISGKSNPNSFFG